jgi:hypothetical protein
MSPASPRGPRLPAIVVLIFKAFLPIAEREEVLAYLLAE